MDEAQILEKLEDWGIRELKELLELDDEFIFEIEKDTGIKLQPIINQFQEVEYERKTLEYNPVLNNSTREVAQQFMENLYPLIASLHCNRNEDVAIQVFSTLIELLKDPESDWELSQLKEKLIWVTPNERAKVISRLKMGGWLESFNGIYNLTPIGSGLASILCALSGKQDDFSHDFDIAFRALEIADQLGNSVYTSYHNAYARLLRDKRALVEAIDTLSITKLKEVFETTKRHIDHIDKLLDYSRKLEDEEGENSVDEGRGRFQEMHLLCQEILALHAQVEKQIQHLLEKDMRLLHFISMQDIERYLQVVPIDELTELGKNAFRSIHLLTERQSTERLFDKGEEYLLRERQPERAPQEILELERGEWFSQEESDEPKLFATLLEKYKQGERIELESLIVQDTWEESLVSLVVLISVEDKTQQRPFLDRYSLNIQVDDVELITLENKPIRQMSKGAVQVNELESEETNENQREQGGEVIKGVKQTA